MKIKFILIATIFFGLTSNAIESGVYYVTGNDSKNGFFQGQLEVRCESTCIFNRWIRFEKMNYHDLQVEQVWSGTVSSNTVNQLKLTYESLQFGFINKLNDVARSELNKKKILSTAEYKDVGYGLYQGSFDNHSTESISFMHAVDKQPIYQFDRKYLASNSAVRGLKRKLVNLLLRKYQKDSFVQSYKGRDDFKKAVHYFIQDKSLLNFYRENKTSLVLEQKNIDNISLAEAFIKRNAYVYTLPEKENLYFKDLLKYHTNELGMIVGNNIQPDGSIKYIDDGDGALWTGTIVAAMAFKYLKTGDPEAYQQMKKSLNGLLLLTEVLSDSDSFARTVRLKNVPIEEGWQIGNKPYDYLQFKPGGNNDMLRGIVYGYLLGFMALEPDETLLRSRLKMAANKIYSKTDVVKKKVWNRPMVAGLMAVVTGESKYKSEFVKAFREPRTWFVNFGINTTFYWAGITDWSGVHLSSIQSLIELILADALQTPKLKAKLQKENARSWVEIKRTDRIINTIIGKAFAYDQLPQNERNEMDYTYVPWVEHTLNEVPFPRPVLNAEIDLSQNPNWSISPFPRMPWKFVAKKDLPASYGYQGLYNYPVYEVGIFGSNYLWKDSAFDYYQRSHANEKYSGIDYLHAYWLAKFFNVIQN